MAPVPICRSIVKSAAHDSSRQRKVVFARKGPLTRVRANRHSGTPETAWKRLTFRSISSGATLYNNAGKIRAMAQPASAVVNQSRPGSRAQFTLPFRLPRPSGDKGQLSEH